MRNVTILSGDGGTGKSLLALQLAVGVAGERKWIGDELSGGTVLYFSAEDDRDEIHVRLDSICLAEGLSVAELKRLHLAVLAGEDAVLANEKDGSSMQTTRLFDQLRVSLAFIRPRLLVLDNLADIFAGNENSRPLARQFMNQLRRISIDYDCAVLLLAHPSLSGISSGSGTSGNTAWNNSARSRLYLVRNIDKHGFESDPDSRTLQVKKANYGSTGRGLPLRWEAGRFVVLGNPEEAPDTAGRALKARRVFLTLLKWHLDHRIAVSPAKSPTYAPARFAEHHQSEGLAKKEFERAMFLLLEEGCVKIVEEGPPSKRRSRFIYTEVL